MHPKAKNMDLPTLVLVAIGLSLDTFAVSISVGLMKCHIRFWQATRLALVLAFFQGGLPVLGWFVGDQIISITNGFGHYVAFALLSGIGIKMIIESLKPEEKRNPVNPFKLIVIVGMAISTSIDALVVGFSFAFIDVNIFHALIIIGFTTYLFGMLGMLFGKKAGMRFGKRMEIVGGVVLLGLGLKILIENLNGSGALM